MSNTIGVIIGYKKDTDLLEKFKQATELGLSCCQLTMWDVTMFCDEYKNKIEEASKATGMKVSAIWGGWTGPCEWNFSFGPSTIGLVPAAYRGQRLKELEMASEFAASLGVDTVITHVGFLPENPSDPDYIGTIGALRRLCKNMKAREQTFLFETGQETPVVLLRAIENIGYDNVGINLDTGNLVLYGKANPLDALDVFGPYVRQTHIKDGFYPTCGSLLGKEARAGDGKANIPAVIKKLCEMGYEGPFLIEREIKGDEQIRDIIHARDLISANLPAEN